MMYGLNQDFYWIKKGEGISVTSILPDQNEIFHFNGPAAKLLEQWFSVKDVNIDQSILQGGMATLGNFKTHFFSISPLYLSKN